MSDSPTLSSLTTTLSDLDLDDDVKDKIIDGAKRDMSRGVTQAKKSWTKDLEGQGYITQEQHEKGLKEAREMAVRETTRDADRRERFNAILSNKFEISKYDDEGKISDAYKDVTKKLKDLRDDPDAIFDVDVAMSTDKGVNSMLAAIGLEPKSGNSSSSHNNENQQAKPVREGQKLPDGRDFPALDVLEKAHRKGHLEGEVLEKLQDPEKTLDDADYASVESVLALQEAGKYS